MPQAPHDPRTGKYIPLMPEGFDQTKQQKACVVEQKADYLLCKLYDDEGNLGQESVPVLKPWDLRRTPFDGKTVNGKAYTYSSDYERENTTDGEDQQITQDYYVDAEIYYVYVNVPEEIETELFCQIMDGNSGARAWAVVPE